MRYHENILSVIGNTPLVKLNKVSSGLAPLFLAKLEYLNPGGSVKDRIGPAMVDDAEARGLLRPGGTIIEGTSGNTGVGLALTAAVRGYRCVFTMNDKQSREKQLLLKSFGAQIVVCPTAVAPDDPRSYYSVARRIHAETPNSVYPNQYDNQSNPMAHYSSTGPEIWRDTDGRVTHVFIASGTGGTISGIGKFLKEKNPAVKMIGVDPEGSILRLYKETGEYHPELARPYKVEGFGEDIIPRATWFDVIDEFVTVNDEESFVAARRLAREEGVFGGGSAGSAVAGMIKYARKENLGPDAVCVVLIPDSGSRYVTKFFSDEWMVEQGYMPRANTAEAVLASKATPGELLIARWDETVRAAIEIMNRHGVSQLPVVDEKGEVVGSLDERDLMTRAIVRPGSLDERARVAMTAPMPKVEVDAPLQQVVDTLGKQDAVLVTRGASLAGILTKYDLVRYLSQR